jgi:hypothetical protein
MVRTAMFREPRCTCLAQSVRAQILRYQACAICAAPGPAGFRPPCSCGRARYSGPVHISYSERNSLLAQITQRGLNPRAGDKVAKADGISLDGFCSLGGAVPRLVKIDVEGSEAAVLRGARGLLSRPDRPAILFEYNPVTLTECGASVHSLLDLLPGYALHYVNDLAGQNPFWWPGSTC